VVNRDAADFGAMTEALFSDLAALGEPVIYVLDDFHDASPSFADFIFRRFLPYVPLSPWVRVLIAGRKIRVPNNIEWADQCERIFDLGGVAEPKHWVPVVLAMKRRVQDRNLEDFLAGACAAFNGRPDRIMQFIEAKTSKETA
jgi:hypothetical protein